MVNGLAVSAPIRDPFTDEVCYQPDDGPAVLQFGKLGLMEMELFQRAIRAEFCCKSSAYFVRGLLVQRVPMEFLRVESLFSASSSLNPPVATRRTLSTRAAIFLSPTLVNIFPSTDGFCFIRLTSDFLLKFALAPALTWQNTNLASTASAKN